MIVIGLTGSIGMGKSTAASMLARMGCGVHESDAAAHAALAPGGKAFEEVAVTFPKAWDKNKHRIRRDILGQVVFEDETKRKALEQILHPLVRESQMEFLRREKNMGRKIAVLDIPLLFETGAQNRVDYTICVTAPYEIQKRRVLARGISEDKFLKILSSQMPDMRKRALADFIVHTGLGMAYTYASLQKIIKEIKNENTGGKTRSL